MSISVDRERLWQRLADMARIGATAKGGSNRQALSNEDLRGRDLFERWCVKAGCEIRKDPIGNIFARRAGRDPSLSPVMSGSHLDTQPTGGKFDGVYGVLGALEVVETLNDRGIETEHPIDVVVWTNEEGSRFDCAMMGSAVWSGSMSLAAACALADKDGVTVGDELTRLRVAGSAAFNHNVKAAFELHIEQGPILEDEGIAIGIVVGVQHMCRYRITFAGVETHAGTTPMSARKDPMRSLASFLAKAYAAADEHGADSRVTFGYVHASPGSPNTVPGSAELTLDLRHPRLGAYESMQAAVEAAASDEASRFGTSVTVRRVWEAPGVEFDAACVETVRRAADAAGLNAMEMVSGAGHDACNVAAVAPTSMIFVPCDGGLSHNEVENISADQAANGANTLLHAMLAAAI